jgi:hypothetical protein
LVSPRKALVISIFCKRLTGEGEGEDRGRGEGRGDARTIYIFQKCQLKIIISTYQLKTRPE